MFNSLFRFNLMFLFFWFGVWIEAVVSVDRRVGLIVRGPSSAGFHSFNRIWVRVVGGSDLGLVCGLLRGLILHLWFGL